MEAYLLQKVDREHELHLQAWLNNQVKAEKKVGKTSKPVFKEFKDFFDYEKRIADVTGKKVEKEVDIAAKRLSEAFKFKTPKKGG